MLAALTQLLLFQLAGEVVARGLDLPLPGPVLGMLFLLAVLALRGGPSAELQGTSQSLLQHWSLLFDALRVRDPALRGFALGMASHGIGMARARGRPNLIFRFPRCRPRLQTALI